MNPYKKPLKVSNTKGLRIEALITPMREFVNVKLSFIEAVKKDKPSFAKEGVIALDVSKKNYTLMIIMIEKYLETLFLKELNNEDRDSSIGIDYESRGVEKLRASRGIKKVKREGSITSLHSGTRRIKSTEDTTRRHSDIDMVKKHNN